jgi:2-methylcitrate dehydratase PrpD
VLKTTKGATYNVDVPLAKGEPENPASDEDIIAKYRHNAEGQDSAVVEKLLQVLLSLEKHSASDVTALMAKMRRG